MTGFGRGEYAGKHKTVIVEVKSVNHRYNEIMIKMPRQYSLLEDMIRKQILNTISRGRIEAYVKIEDTSGKQKEVQVDKELALAYYKALKELAILTQTPEGLDVIQLAQLPEVLKIEEAEEILEEIMLDIQPALQVALQALGAMRETEGAKLNLDLSERLLTIINMVAKIEEKSPLVVGLYRDKLQVRLKELLEEIPLDENRIAMEVAVFADRCNITEELVRLQSHFSQFQNSLKEHNPVGRKLDFLLQEMNREVNTIGSKANDLNITQYVIELKSELEKVREQIQNIE
jgi:uncharacterized protein (TIGR00255 family)